MKLTVLFALLTIAHCTDAAQPSFDGQLTVTVTYKGSHVLDRSHRICVGLLRQRELAHPVAVQLADENTNAVVFHGIRVSPVLALAAILAPSNCAGNGSPIPAGSVFGFYETSGQPQPVQLTPSHQAHIKIELTDSHLFEESRVSKLARLQDPSIPGTPSVVYTPPYANRARQLQELIRDELSFYEKELKIRLRPLTLAVLDSTQWSKLESLPYGIPNEHGGVIMMAADWKDTHIFPITSKLPASRLVNQALAAGHSWTSVLYEGADGTLTHEVGHLIGPQLGIYTTTEWLKELMASYFGYAFLMAKRHQEILPNKIFWLNGLLGQHPLTSLADFENPKGHLSPENMNWYECAFEQRVIQVYRTNGFQFIREIQKAFPVTGSDMNVEQTLDKLESVSPGWRKWAYEMEVNQIEAVD
jgi:hypothetical protein